MVILLMNFFCFLIFGQEVAPRPRPVLQTASQSADDSGQLFFMKPGNSYGLNGGDSILVFPHYCDSSPYSFPFESLSKAPGPNQGLSFSTKVFSSKHECAEEARKLTRVLADAEARGKHIAIRFNSEGFVEEVKIDENDAHNQLGNIQLTDTNCQYDDLAFIQKDPLSNFGCQAGTMLTKLHCNQGGLKYTTQAVCPPNLSANDCLLKSIDGSLSETQDSDSAI